MSHSFERAPFAFELGYGGQRLTPKYELAGRLRRFSADTGVSTSTPSHSHDSSGNDAPSLISNPATPAKAGAHGKSGSRPSPGKRGGDVELHQLNESVHWDAPIMNRTSGDHVQV